MQAKDRLTQSKLIQNVIFARVVGISIKPRVRTRGIKTNGGQAGIAGDSAYATIIYESHLPHRESAVIGFSTIWAALFADSAAYAWPLTALRIMFTYWPSDGPVNRCRTFYAI